MPASVRRHGTRLLGRGRGSYRLVTTAGVQFDGSRLEVSPGASKADIRSEAL